MRWNLPEGSYHHVRSDHPGHVAASGGCSASLLRDRQRRTCPPSGSLATPFMPSGSTCSSSRTNKPCATPYPHLAHRLGPPSSPWPGHPRAPAVKHGPPITLPNRRTLVSVRVSVAATTAATTQRLPQLLRRYDGAPHPRGRAVPRRTTLPVSLPTSGAQPLLWLIGLVWTLRLAAGFPGAVPEVGVGRSYEFQQVRARPADHLADGAGEARPGSIDYRGRLVAAGPGHRGRG